MTAINLDALPAETIGLKLHRIDSQERLHACETVTFTNGRAAVNTVLRRAALAGRVEVEGTIENHFADVIVDMNGTWVTTVALDAKSYGSLKNHWMRCKLEAGK